jgi:hypothetical protein
LRFHVLKRNLQNLWRRKAVRVIAIGIVVAVTILVQYLLENRPQPVDLSSNKVTVPDIFGGQKLLVEALGAGSELLIAHVGKLSEEVDVHLSKARLGPTTILDYQDEHPPTTASEVHCSPTNWQDQGVVKPPKSAANDSSAKPKPCSTSIAITPVAGNQSVIELDFFQTDTNGRDRYRHLVTEARNAEANVKLKLVPRLTLPTLGSSTPKSLDSPGVDCGRYLTVGDWQQRIGGATEIETVMESGSALRTRFTALESGLWSGVDGYFEPFSLRSQQPGNATTSTPLKARSVSIQSADGRQTIFLARSADDSLIRIDNLKVGTDRLQVTIDGTAYVTINGELVSESFLKQIEKYPLIAVALGALNLAIFAWCVKVAKGLF